jgi:3-deoxy-manno-octulosonate cytidylyltransferase (CMP-KDO synthetase)
MTSASCLTGTDRVAEVARIFERDYYINVQGDEPLISVGDLKKVILEVCRPSGNTKVFNAMTTIKVQEDFFNPNIPKVVFDGNNRLMYISRAGVPMSKQGTFVQGYKQVCIYGFERDTLLEVMGENIKAPNESIEDIEILRFLERGYDVQMVPVSDNSVAVDTREDLAKVRKIIENLGV